LKLLVAHLLQLIAVIFGSAEGPSGGGGRFDLDDEVPQELIINGIVRFSM
jgi:hypothetical protein